MYIQESQSQEERCPRENGVQRAESMGRVRGRDAGRKRVRKKQSQCEPNQRRTESGVNSVWRGQSQGSNQGVTELDWSKGKREHMERRRESRRKKFKRK